MLFPAHTRPLGVRELHSGTQGSPMHLDSFFPPSRFAQLASSQDYPQASPAAAACLLLTAVPESSQPAGLSLSGLLV